MANFSFKTFTEHLQSLIDVMTANSTQIINFGEGSVLRVLFEAVCARLDYFTIQLRKILLLCRLATSTGEDVDSFIADFGMDARLSAVGASGLVTFSRNTAGVTSVLVPVGSTVISFDDTVTYEVIVDANNINYNSTLGGYVIQPNQTGIDASIRAVNTGSIGNVSANTITIVGSTLPGVDSVTNASALTNGRDAETDDQVKARFVKYIATRARATKLALEYAIDIVQSGLVYIVKENIDIDNNEQLGHVVIVVDDGSGNPPSEVMDAIRASVDLYRGFTISVDVYSPTILTTTASLSVGVSSAYTAGTVRTAVQTAIVNYLNSQSFGEFLSPERLASIAFAVPGVIDVNNCLLNGSATDIQPAFNELVKAGTVTVS